MPDWVNDKAWSDRYLLAVKRILGEHLIGPPPKEEDELRNTDLIVLRMEAVRIGVRIRRQEYHEEYGGEFTMWCGRPRGTKTELRKIIEGWGQYFFYGFGDTGGDLTAWGLGDLNVFRGWFNESLASNGGRAPGVRKSNQDGSSDFMAFRWLQLPPEFVVASFGLIGQEAGCDT